MGVYQKAVGDWFFNVKLNASTMKNKVIEVGEDIQQTIGSGDHWDNATVTRNGYPIASFYGRRVEGVFQSQAEIDALNAATKGEHGGFYQEAGTRPGDYRFKDLNGDGYINDLDREIIGDGFPDLNYGLNIGVSYKNWDLNLYMYGVGGQKILSYAYMNLSSMFTGTEGYRNILREAANNAWTAEKPNNQYPRLTRQDLNMNTYVSDAYLKNGDFLKMQNFQVGYTFPKGLIKPLQLDNVRVFASVENLFTFTGYVANLDPELSTSTTTMPILRNGVDEGRYPLPRTYTFGLTVGF
jgi:hypothetical protein